MPSDHRQLRDETTNDSHTNEVLSQFSLLSLVREQGGLQ